MSSNRNKRSYHSYYVHDDFHHHQMDWLDHHHHFNFDEEVDSEPVVMDEVIISIHHEKEPVITAAARTLGYTAITTAATHALDVYHTRKVTNKPSATSTQGLSKGFGFNLGTNMVRNSLLFFGIPMWESILKDQFPQAYSKPLAFGLASVIEGVVWSPIGYVKQMIYSDPNIKTPFDVFRNTSFREMLAATRNNAVYGGLLRNSLTAFPYMMLFEEGQKRFIHEGQSDAERMAKAFALGMVSGVVPSAFAYPLQWLCMTMTDRPYEKVLDVIAKNYKKDGIRAFYNGAGISIMRLGVMSGCMSLSFFATDILCKKLGIFSKKPEPQMSVEAPDMPRPKSAK